MLGYIKAYAWQLTTMVNTLYRSKLTYIYIYVYMYACYLDRFLLLQILKSVKLTIVSVTITATILMEATTALATMDTF